MSTLKTSGAIFGVVNRDNAFEPVTCVIKTLYNRLGSIYNVFNRLWAHVTIYNFRS